MHDLAPLPPFINPYVLCRKAASLLLPPVRIKVSEAAERYRYISSPGYSGPWRNDFAPYMVEPMDQTANPETEAVVFVGPAQSLKTDSLVLNTVVHTVVCNPADTLVVHMSQGEARMFSKQRIDGLIRSCPEVRQRLSPNPRDDNIHDKRFAGMMLSIGYPSVNVLSSKPIAVVIFTDYDRMPSNLDGEGEPFDLGRKRTTTIGSRAITVAESSPGRPILSGNWQPETPHEAPPTTGILALYNRGDRRRWYWPCPECGGYFESSFKHLKWPDTVTKDRAHLDVTMACPHCGSMIGEDRKRDMNSRGVWLRDGETITADGVRGGNPRTSNIASYWMKGTSAALQSWSSLVRNWLQAKDDFDRTGSEEGLKATTNIDQGEAWLPMHLADEDGADVDSLMARAKQERYRLKEVPEGCLVLIATVDTQGNRFEYAVHGFGPGGAVWIIDRDRIVRPADGAERLLDPARYPDDWTLITERIVKASYPLADGSGRRMKVMVTGIDMHGAPGVSSRAYDYWRSCRRAGLGKKVRLLRGDDKGDKAAPRVIETFPDSKRKDRHAEGRGEVPVLGVNATPVKDEVLTLLKNDNPDVGGGYLHIPADLIADDGERQDYLLELTAEIRDPKHGWKQRRKRNESWDLLVYARALWLYLKIDRVVNWDSPPVPWLKDWDSNPMIIKAEEATVKEEEKAKVPIWKRLAR